MATAGSNNRGSFQRFDGKLDSTLRKTLTLEEYERLSITESCIVVTDDGKRSQKLVTVGHSALYFCNIPPKSVKRILYLTQIISCTTVNDVPNFLPSAERHNVLHINIQYLTHEPQRSRSVSPFKRSSSLPTSGAATPTRSSTPNASVRVRTTASLITRRRGTLTTPFSEPSKASLDLYILQGRQHTSQLNHHLHVVLEDILMESLNIERQHQLINDRQHLSIVAHYEPLKAELLQLTDIKQDYDHSASLMVELKQGADKYHVLKKVFWQDLDVIRYCIDAIQNSSAIDNHWDKIEYCVIISELLLTVLHQSYLCLNRTRLVLQDGGILTDQLVRSLLTIIERSMNRDKEVIELCQEFACNAAGIVNEIFCIIQQVTWLVPSFSMVGSYNEQRLCELMIHQSGTVVFMTRLTEMVCNCIDKKQFQLKLYLSLCFIEKVIVNSEDWLTFIQKHFKEEFQYIIIFDSSKKPIYNKLNDIRRKIIP